LVLIKIRRALEKRHKKLGALRANNYNMPSFFKKLKTDIAEETKPAKVKKTPKKPGTKKVVFKKEKEETKEQKKEKTEKKKKQGWLKPEGQLVVDVFYTDSDFCVQSPIAGINKEDIDISIEDKMLVIKGEREEPLEGKGKNYFYQECYWGPFSRQVILPEDVDSQRIKASLEKGVLLIKIPRVIKVSKKKVDISIKD